MKLAECRSCGASIVWVTTTNGKKMPVDADPVAARFGFRLDEDGAVVTARFTTAPEPGEKVYVSHLSTCAYAEEHRP